MNNNLDVVLPRKQRSFVTFGNIYADDTIDVFHEDEHTINTADQQQLDIPGLIIHHTKSVNEHPVCMDYEDNISADKKEKCGLSRESSYEILVIPIRSASQEYLEQNADEKEKVTLIHVIDDKPVLVSKASLQKHPSDLSLTVSSASVSADIQGSQQLSPKSTSSVKEVDGDIKIVAQAMVMASLGNAAKKLGYSDQDIFNELGIKMNINNTVTYEDIIAKEKQAISSYAKTITEMSLIGAAITLGYDPKEISEAFGISAENKTLKEVSKSYNNCIENMAKEAVFQAALSLGYSDIEAEMAVYKSKYKEGVEENTLKTESSASLLAKTLATNAISEAITNLEFTNKPQQTTERIKSPSLQNQSLSLLSLTSVSSEECSEPYNVVCHNALRNAALRLGYSHHEVNNVIGEEKMCKDDANIRKWAKALALNALTLASSPVSLAETTEYANKPETPILNKNIVSLKSLTSVSSAEYSESHAVAAHNALRNAALDLGYSEKEVVEVIGEKKYHKEDANIKKWAEALAYNAVKLGLLSQGEKKESLQDFIGRFESSEFSVVDISDVRFDQSCNGLAIEEMYGDSFFHTKQDEGEFLIKRYSVGQAKIVNQKNSTIKSPATDSDIEEELKEMSRVLVEDVIYKAANTLGYSDIEITEVFYNNREEEDIDEDNKDEQRSFAERFVKHILEKSMAIVQEQRSFKESEINDSRYRKKALKFTMIVIGLACKSLGYGEKKILKALIKETNRKIGACTTEFHPEILVKFNESSIEEARRQTLTLPNRGRRGSVRDRPATPRPSKKLLEDNEDSSEEEINKAHHQVNLSTKNIQTKERRPTPFFPESFQQKIIEQYEKEQICKLEIFEEDEEEDESENDSLQKSDSQTVFPLLSDKIIVSEKESIQIISSDQIKNDFSDLTECEIMNKIQKQDDLEKEILKTLPEYPTENEFLSLSAAADPYTKNISPCFTNAERSLLNLLGQQELAPGILDLYNAIQNDIMKSLAQTNSVLLNLNNGFSLVQTNSTTTSFCPVYKNLAQNVSPMMGSFIAPSSPNPSQAKPTLMPNQLFERQESQKQLCTPTISVIETEQESSLPQDTKSLSTKLSQAVSCDNKNKSSYSLLPDIDSTSSNYLMGKANLVSRPGSLTPEDRRGSQLQLPKIPSSLSKNSIQLSAKCSVPRTPSLPKIRSSCSSNSRLRQLKGSVIESLPKVSLSGSVIEKETTELHNISSEEILLIEETEVVLKAPDYFKTSKLEMTDMKSTIPEKLNTVETTKLCTQTSDIVNVGKTKIENEKIKARPDTRKENSATLIKQSSSSKDPVKITSEVHTLRKGGINNKLSTMNTSSQMIGKVPATSPTNFVSSPRKSDDPLHKVSFRRSPTNNNKESLLSTKKTLLELNKDRQTKKSIKDNTNNQNVSKDQGAPHYALPLKRETAVEEIVAVKKVFSKADGTPSVFERLASSTISSAIKKQNDSFDKGTRANDVLHKERITKISNTTNNAQTISRKSIEISKSHDNKERSRKNSPKSRLSSNSLIRKTTDVIENGVKQQEISKQQKEDNKEKLEVKSAPSFSKNFQPKISNSEKNNFHFIPSKRNSLLHKSLSVTREKDPGSKELVATSKRNYSNFKKRSKRSLSKIKKVNKEEDEREGENIESIKYKNYGPSKESFEVVQNITNGGSIMKVSRENFNLEIVQEDSTKMKTVKDDLNDFPAEIILPDEVTNVKKIDRNVVIPTAEKKDEKITEDKNQNESVPRKSSNSIEGKEKIISRRSLSRQTLSKTSRKSSNRIPAKTSIATVSLNFIEDKKTETETHDKTKSNSNGANAKTNNRVVDENVSISNIEKTTSLKFVPDQPKSFSKILSTQSMKTISAGSRSARSILRSKSLGSTGRIMPTDSRHRHHSSTFRESLPMMPVDERGDCSDFANATFPPINELYKQRNSSKIDSSSMMWMPSQSIVNESDDNNISVEPSPSALLVQAAPLSRQISTSSFKSGHIFVTPAASINFVNSPQPENQTRIQSTNSIQEVKEGSDHKKLY